MGSGKFIVVQAITVEQSITAIFSILKIAVVERFDFKMLDSLFLLSTTQSYVVEYVRYSAIVNNIVFKSEYCQSSILREPVRH